MSLVTGMTTINVTDTSDERVEFYNMSAGTTIDVTATDTTNTTVEVVYTDDTSATDAQTFVVAAATADDNVAIVIDDIETINISSDTAAQVDLSLAGVSMTAATARNTVNFTGTNDIELAATGADVTTIDASGMGTGGAITQTARTATEASTYTGSAGDDTFIMMSAADVLDGAAGTGDTLDVNMAQAVGTAIFDLSSTTDQMTSFNGGTNSTVVKGFENLDLAGVTLNGAVVTGSSAANTIVGSGLVDQIDGGAGADVITGGAGNDVITGGAGVDKFVFSSTPTANAVDTITDFVVGSSGDGMNVLALDSTFATALKIATLSDANGTFTSLAGTATAGDVDVLILLDSTGFANVGAAEDEYTATAGDVTDDDGLVVVYYDSTSTTLKVAFDAAEGADSAGGVTVIAELSNLGASDLASLTSDNFIIA